MKKQARPTSWKSNEAMWWVALPGATGRRWRFEWQGTAQSGNEAVIRAKEAARLALPDSQGRDQMSHLRDQDFEMESYALDKWSDQTRTHELSISGPFLFALGSREERLCDSPVPESEVRRVTRQAEGMIIKLLALDESVSWALADHHAFSFHWNAGALRCRDSGFLHRRVNIEFRDGYGSVLTISPIIVNAIMRLLFNTRGGPTTLGTFFEVTKDRMPALIGNRDSVPAAAFTAARDRVRKNPERSLGPILWRLHRLGSDELAAAIVRTASRLDTGSESGCRVSSEHPAR